SGKDVIGGFTFSRLLSKPFIRWLVTFYRSGDLVITPSSYTRDMIIDFGVSEEKIRVVSNGVDYEKVKFSRKKRKKYRDKFDLNKPTVIGVGQVIARKAISLFVQAAHLLPQYEFIWFGSRMNKLMMYDRDMDQAIANAPANMTFTGYVEDIQAAYSSGDLFFFPSYEENQGIVLLEAATRGIPIVTRDLPVYQGWLKDGDNCLKGNSLDQFVKLIEKGIENEDLRESLVSNAKEMADQHRLENIGERYLQIYERHLR
ncbi:MAG: glycosyltransferase family 4 protein, partial [Candidatus Acetothermia bacterium]